MRNQKMERHGNGMHVDVVGSSNSISSLFTKHNSFNTKLYFWSFKLLKFCILFYFMCLFNYNESQRTFIATEISVRTSV